MKSPSFRLHEFIKIRFLRLDVVDFSTARKNYPHQETIVSRIIAATILSFPFNGNEKCPVPSPAPLMRFFDGSRRSFVLGDGKLIFDTSEYRTRDPLCCSPFFPSVVAADVRLFYASGTTGDCPGVMGIVPSLRRNSIAPVRWIRGGPENWSLNFCTRTMRM